MPDVKGLLNDPEFQKLDLPTQKSTLGKLDSDFATLSDGDYLKFRTGMQSASKPKQLTTIEKIRNYIGTGSTQTPTAPLGEKTFDYPPWVYKTGMAVGGLELGVGLASKFVPGLIAGAGRFLADEAAGAAPKAATAAANSSTSGASGVAQAVANKLPQIHPVARFIAKWTPGLGGVSKTFDLIEALQGKFGQNLEEVPQIARNELAQQLYKDANGKFAETTAEKIQATKDFDDAMRGIPPAGRLAHELYEEAHGAAPQSASEKVQALKEYRKALRVKGVKGVKGVKKASVGAVPPSVPEPATEAYAKPSLSTRVGKQYPKQEPLGGVESASTGSKYVEYGEQPIGTTASRELNPGKTIGAQAKAKNMAMATRFKGLSLTREQISKMTEAEYNQHRIAENVIRKQQGLPQMDPPRPGPNRRSFVELKADILKEFDQL